MVGTTWAMRFLSVVAMLLFPTAIWAILVARRKGEMLEETHDWAAGSLEREGDVAVGDSDGDGGVKGGENGGVGVKELDVGDGGVGFHVTLDLEGGVLCA
ncbi:hypothetical protein AAC387_Pa03g0344 [Persea americana]